MSVADILKKAGKWTTSDELVKLVIKELQVVDRTAYRKIEREVKSGAIRKLPLPDRSVLYGLPNWPLENLDLNQILEIWKVHIRDQEAFTAQLEAWAKLFEATKQSKDE